MGTILTDPYAATRSADQSRLLSERNAALLISGPVNPETYVLGPGDLVGLEITGVYSLSSEDVVGADGSVTFPQLGTFWFADKTLAEARKMIRDRGHSLLRNAQPELVLKSTRTFKVFVTGSVAHPGSQAATPLTRLSEVLQESGGFLPASNIRKISITHRDSTVGPADLLEFLYTGGVDKNPLMRDGDVINVRPRTDEITVAGAVLHPGRIDYVEGDELGTLLRIVELHPRSDRNHAIVQRFRNDVTWDTLNVELGPFLNGVTQMPLKPGDRILIRGLGEWRMGSMAEVRGSVAFPGPIPVERGTINVAQAIQLAGGFLPDATPERVVLGKPFIPDSTRLSDPLGNKSYMQALSSQGLHERIVDLTKGSGPMVEPDDIITVPQKEAWVQVLGQVVNPGFYPYYPKWSPTNYIRAAGGYAHNAHKSKTQISRGRFGDIGYARDYDTVAPGDVLYVPEKNVQGFWATLRDIIVVSGQAAALILVVRDITR
jgi:protein involved in polysaccharide export with SLBB domain